MVNLRRCSAKKLLVMLCAATTVVVFLLSTHVRHLQKASGSPYDDVNTAFYKRQIPSRLSPSSDVRSDDVSDYDVAEVSRWYRGSACSGRASEFVGDQPFFPPCSPDLPSPGVAKWGQFPYLGPFNYINESKNPCWKTLDGGLMCIPYFYLIGVSKSGTSDLYARLASHPHVYHSAKELHYFDRFRYLRNKPEIWHYANRLNAPAKLILTDILTRGKSEIIAGDASPSYFYDNYNWERYSGNENCSEPRVILAQHIYHLNPDAKIIMIIRHPVYRLYSRYLFDYARRKRYDPADPPSPRQFHSFVVDGLQKFRDCFQRWSLRHCIYNQTLFHSFAYIRIQENLYSVLLEDWFRVIPRNQFLFIRFEDYTKDLGTEYRRLIDFLELEPLTEASLQMILNRRVANQGKLAKKTEPMLLKTERLLHEFYQPFLRRFAALLHDRKFLWDDHPWLNRTGQQ